MKLKKNPKQYEVISLSHRQVLLKNCQASMRASEEGTKLTEANRDCSLDLEVGNILNTLNILWVVVREMYEMTIPPTLSTNCHLNV